MVFLIVDRAGAAGGLTYARVERGRVGCREVEGETFAPGEYRGLAGNNEHVAGVSFNSGREPGQTLGREPERFRPTQSTSTVVADLARANPLQLEGPKRRPIWAGKGRSEGPSRHVTDHVRYCEIAAARQTRACLKYCSKNSLLWIEIYRNTR